AGRAAEAIGLHERTLADMERTLGFEHPRVAMALGNLGIVQRRLGKPKDACASLKRALTIFQASYGLDHPEVAKTLVNLGVVQLQLGKLAS
ncbi:MAG: tetratricopeptide repeat protein, partial [Streptosporangiaceae bacterium]